MPWSGLEVAMTFPMLIYEAAGRPDTYITDTLHDDDPPYTCGTCGARVDEACAVTLRLPDDELGACLNLESAHLNVGGCDVQLGQPTVCAIQPSERLRSRIVVISVDGHSRADDGRDGVEFGASLMRQIVEIIGDPGDVSVNVERRRSIQVSGYTIWGYGIRLKALSDDQSLALQASGLGGKQKMGAGVLRAPTK